MSLAETLLPGPRADGPPAAGHRRLRGAAAAAGESRGSRDVPVVAVTAFAMREDRERAAREGFDGYLGKPISVPALPSQVERLPEQGADPMSGDAVTVLAVDDLPQNLRLLDAVLSPRGYRVLTASSGEEALADAAGVGSGPGAPRHRDAGHRRLRGLPSHPSHPRLRVPAGGDDHRERRAGEDPRDRGGRG